MENILLRNLPKYYWILLLGHGNAHEFNSITCYIPDMDMSHPTHELASNSGTTNNPTESKCKQRAPRNALPSLLLYIYVILGHYH